MSVNPATTRLGDFWTEFRRSPSGVVGLVLLVLFAAVAVLGPALSPYPEAGTSWRSIEYWQDEPANAPPAWTNLFAREKGAVSARLAAADSAAEEGEGYRVERASFAYDFSYDRPPLDLILHFRVDEPAPVSVAIERPDGRRVELVNSTVEPVSGEARISLDKEAGAAVLDFVRGIEPPEALERLDGSSLEPTAILFAEAEPGLTTAPRALKGKYRITLETIVVDGAEPASEPVPPRLAVVGRVSGLLGTDAQKRDLFSGAVAGVRYALLIGFLTALVSVAVGVVYGALSAYAGGLVDAAMQRFFEIMSSMPLLPFMIVLSAIFKPSIVTMIVLMVLFFWTGSVKTVRSMALQIKEETYIEAAKALGAGGPRILFRHIVPILVPYSFASMALAVPGAIVYEATVSLLGLGDASIVTWGQILHDALSGGAVLNGVWWWVVPPGLLIALMGMTFAFLGFAMDKILHPKLRTR
ncbi:MAG: ABC transporter permease [Spirochaetaceae bacterium]|nr:ABC transporter permease [Spirochaetaceae bacterium]